MIFNAFKSGVLAVVSVWLLAAVFLFLGFLLFLISQLGYVALAIFFTLFVFTIGALMEILL